MSITWTVLAACCAVRGAHSGEASRTPDRGSAVRPAARLAAEPWPLQDVRLLPGPFRDAQERNLRYVMALEPDRLLGHLRENAGLTARAPSYGGWDHDGNQCIGHYLTALSHMAASTGDPKVSERVRYIVREMAECQKASGDGALYGYASDKAYFARVGAGEVPFINVSPWYITHKLMAGLRDAYLLCGDKQARDVLVGLADWCVRVTAKLTPDQWQAMLDREHGGPHETLADVYALTGDRRYLELAKRFTHEKVYGPLARGDASALNGLHANTQFPKIIGYERIYELTGEKARHDAAVAFWEDVTGRRSWANGGNSQYEHFFPPEEFPRQILEPPGPETCNTYNMLRLTKQLFMAEPSGRLMDYYERALLNHVLASQDPATGSFVYHTPMRPGHYRLYSTPHDCFWCCVNTGMESQSKHGEMIYARAPDGLYVNLYVASEAHWHGRGLTLRQETRFPDEPRTTLHLQLDRPRRLAVRLRWPAWVAQGAFVVRVNGRRRAVQGDPGQYVTLSRIWRDGDTVQVELPMRLHVETLPHSQEYAALLYGPVVLAGRLGTAALSPSDFAARDGDPIGHKVLPVDDFPCIVGLASDAPAHVRAAAGKPLTFETHGLMRPADVTLVPLFRLHHERYAVYWRVRDAEGYAAAAARREAAHRETADLEPRTLDRVVVGDEASEQAHGFGGERTETGPAPWPYTRWRHASGWFSYRLQSPGGQAVLRCVFWGGDTGRTFDVLVDGRLAGIVALKAEQPGEFITRAFTLPATAGAVDVSLRAHEGSLAGGLFDLRVVRPTRG